MRAHLWQDHPNPIYTPNGFKPQKCGVCGLERYHQRMVLHGRSVEYFEMYWRNGRYLGEQDVPCVDWEEEDAKRID